MTDKELADFKIGLQLAWRAYTEAEEHWKKTRAHWCRLDNQLQDELRRREVQDAVNAALIQARNMGAALAGGATKLEEVKS